MINKTSRNALRKKRHLRIKKKIRGTEVRPRLCVFKSLKNIYIQVIDDEVGKTLVDSNTLTDEFKTKSEQKGANIKNAQVIGKLMAQKCLEKNIKSIVFYNITYSCSTCYIS